MLSVAMDGPVGAGKSTVADEVAKRLDILHLDTGAMYRAVGLCALENGIDIDDECAVSSFCTELHIDVRYCNGHQQTYANGREVTSLIRTPEVSMAASTVSKYANVRKIMVELQQNLAKTTSMLLDGRDIGTRVLPDADVKIYLTASDEVRAKRRYKELEEKGTDITFQQTLDEVRRRDYQDMHRSVDPLRKADDAVEVDSSSMTFDETVEKILDIVREKSNG